MQQCGHRIWGLVIYRTTYNSESDWKGFISRLNARLEHCFEFYNGKDILDKFSLTVMDDQQLFDAASTDDIRRHFRTWVTENYTHEQPQALVGEEKLEEWRRVESPRYRYAVIIDSESLHSIIDDAPAPPEKDQHGKGWVKVINKSWPAEPIEGVSERYQSEDRYEDEELEPLEGVTKHDVGWMKIPLYDVMTRFYEYSAERIHWEHVYQRPPTIFRP